MAYTAKLLSDRQLTVINQGSQTFITLTSQSPGQQQSQTNSFTTGQWQVPPQLYHLGEGFVLQSSSHSGMHFLLIRVNSISTIAKPALDNAVRVDLQEVADPPANSQTIEFEPMQPMKMGNMSMDLNSMSMQMGNMSMNMGNTATSTKRFCSQCGQVAKVNARFCSSCGHQLDS